MTFLQALLALVAKHLVATAAVGGLTVAGGAVVVDQIVETPPEAAEAATDEGRATASAAVTKVGSAGQPAHATDAAAAADDTELDVKQQVLPADGEDDAEIDGDNGVHGRSSAVHAVVDGEEVQPGSREFGQAVAAAASEGRSEQRGRSDEARAEHEPDDGVTDASQNDASESDEADDDVRPSAPNEAAAQGQARAETNKQAAHEKRDAAQDRRPAPGDEVDETSTRGRG